MSSYLKGKFYKRFNRFLASVVTGGAGVPAAIVVVSICALLMLAYVTAQIYSTMLSERISALETEQRILREKTHTLTGRYTELASRDRVGRYCESVLGMIEADDESMRRIAIDGGGKDPEFGEFAVKHSFVPEVVGQTMQETNRRD